MRLARRITVAIAAVILAIMAVHAYFLLSHEVALFDADLQRSTRLKQALRATIKRVWETYGAGEAQKLVEETIPAAIPDVDVTWKWLDAAKGDARYLDLPDAQRTQVGGGENLIVLRQAGGDTVRTTYVPLSIAGEPSAVLVFTESVGEQHAFVEMSRWQILLVTLAILAASSLAVYLLGARYVGRPIARLRDRLRAIADGDFETPAAIAQRDEIGDLAIEIDRMSERLADAQRRLAAETDARVHALELLRHTDRLTTIGQLAASVAHELGTPLAVVTGRAEMIANGEATGERTTASARVIVEQASHMTGLIRQLLDFSRHRAPRFGVLSCRALCARAVDTLGVVTRRRRVAITADLPDDPLFVSADEHQLQQAIVNLLVNAMQAVPDGGHIEVATGTRRAAPPGGAAAEGDYVWIVVRDDGPGIPPENLGRLFEPFFTTKGPGEGTGLGLSVAHGIVRDHGGWIDVQSAPGRGSTFTIWLPATAAAQTPPHRAA